MTEEKTVLEKEYLNPQPFVPMPLVDGTEYLMLITEQAFFDKGNGSYNPGKIRTRIEVRRKGENGQK